MKAISKLFLVLVVFSMYSCDDIIENDISNDTITINYPQNNAQIESNVVGFRWNELKGADDYRLQVYSNNQVIVLDTLVSQSNFTYAVTPGTYQWRVRGENSAYKTDYSFPSSFSLTVSEDLTNQQIQLVSPDANVYTQNLMPIFSWSGVAAANSYTFQLVDVTHGNTIILEEPGITNTSYTLSSGVIIDDAQFTWKVKGVNSNNKTETQFATRTFYLDRTAPNQSQSILPANNTTVNVNDDINFTWTVPTDTGAIKSSFSYSIQIANDQNFTSILQTDTTTLPSYSYKITATGIYYWRIKVTDKAGNESNYSNYFKITVQ